MSDMKATLNDKMIARLALADDGQYVVRDADLKGFFLVVGKRKKTFTVNGEFWKDGKRHPKKVAIGAADEMSTRDARTAAKDILAKIAKGEYLAEAKPTDEVLGADITLAQAWSRYRVALERKSRSDGTINGYRDHVERLLKDWLETPLKSLGENPALVSKRHDELTASAGPYPRHPSIEELLTMLAPGPARRRRGNRECVTRKTCRRLIW
jgi:hypothetical protein